jgi:flavin reductase (DIM6/NTAB) family NADH-FMN oxidoreductase RutF
VVTAPGPYGVTVNAFTFVSLAPPIVAVCLSAGARSGEIIEASGVFAVNMLAAGLADLSRRFARPGRQAGADSFTGLASHTGRTGSPILHGTAGFLDCLLAGRHRVGDHVIMLGEVLAVGADVRAAPLVFHRGRVAS